MPRSLLIEKWLPLAELGIESKRERGASSALPPLYFLHVWWARRPLTMSRAAILASLLPQWSEDWPEDLKTKFPDEESYGQWFLELLGIYGDPIEAKKEIDKANKEGRRLGPNPYGYKRAFTNIPGDEELEILNKLLEVTWGKKDVSVSDPMAGGGSIPFESIRYGFKTHSNDLNPVAAVIQKATLEYPIKYGNDLLKQIKKYGEIWAERVEEKLAKYFPVQEYEKVQAYIWARTVPCPTTGKPVPLSPNWWLRKGDNPVAVKLICNPDWDQCHFEIVEGKTKTKEVKPDEGTVKRGIGISPWTGETISLEYIHEMGKKGEIKQQMYAVAVKRQKGGFLFRGPTEEELRMIGKAEEIVSENILDWEAKSIIPTEDIPEGHTTAQPMRYGMKKIQEFFSSRQLLSLKTFLETLKEIEIELDQDIQDQGLKKAILTYLGIVLDKAVDRNSMFCIWIPQRCVISHTFARHDFSVKWSYAEFDASRNLLPWAIEQVTDAYKELVKLGYTEKQNLYKISSEVSNGRINITSQNAANLENIEDASIEMVCVDPPYYDNVMYSESSDFYYVWMKRSIGHLYPEFFTEELTNKDDEAVANAARFGALSRGKKRELAEKDYERKMAACFKEMYRILKSDGVLTLMFTHKKTEAWNTLGRALIEAGFSIKSSWPVHTEYEKGLHQNKKNAAASTILLVCRKRIEKDDPVWWEDIRGRIREEAKRRAVEFQGKGIDGVDLYISTFGPVLSILSDNWPVYTGEIDENTGDPRLLSPEVALNIAREEVLSLRKKGLLGGQDIKFDPFTDWYILSWDLFKAEEFPFDEARKLAMALNLDIDSDVSRGKKLIRKRSNFVSLRKPNDRQGKNLVDPEREAFDCYIDLVHTAMLLYEEDGSRACEMFLKEHGLFEDGTFKAVMEALIKAIPRTKEKDKFLRPEAETMEKMRLAFFSEIEAPPEEKQERKPSKLPFSGGSSIED